MTNIHASWVETLYAAIEFFYWEPQHLGRQRNAGHKPQSVTTVRKRLRRLKVTLNHSLDQFFRLAPQEFRRQLFQHAVRRPFGDQLVLHGTALDADFGLGGCMQPDFVFESSSDLVCVEMKVRSRSSIGQVLKYALLGLAAEMNCGTVRSHSLLLLGRGDFASFWPERFESPAALRSAALQTDLDAFLNRAPQQFRAACDRLRTIVSEMQIASLPYSQLAAILRSAAPGQHDASVGAEVYRNLLDGMLGELRTRGLA